MGRAAHSAGGHPGAPRLVASKIAERAPFMDSLKVQLRILWALFMREVLTRYGRHNIGFLW